jgi:predicted metal-binding membrane protein
MSAVPATYGSRPPRPAPLWLPWRLALVALLVGMAAAAWAVTDLRMGGMDDGPGTDPGTLGFYVSTWVVMMAAMMFPSVAPMVLTYVRLHRGRRERGLVAPAGAVAVFLGGYLAAWTGAGLAAYGLLEAGRALDGGALAWDRAGRWVAVGVLAAAALYELTPLKHACLRRCRGPLGFFMESWREGRTGALRMGVAHGAWCVGCCWALMAALFALGAMSLGWMAFVAALIALEKLAPWERVATYAVTALLVALAVAMAVTPEDVPGLTIPGEGMHMEHDAPASEPMSRPAPMPMD